MGDKKSGTVERYFRKRRSHTQQESPKKLKVEDPSIISIHKTNISDNIELSIKACHIKLHGSTREVIKCTLSRNQLVFFFPPPIQSNLTINVGDITMVNTSSSFLDISLTLSSLRLTLYLKRSIFSLPPSLKVNRLDIRLSDEERPDRRGDFVGNLSQLVLNKPNITFPCRHSSRKKSVVVLGDDGGGNGNSGDGGGVSIGKVVIDIGSEESDNNKSNGDRNKNRKVVAIDRKNNDNNKKNNRDNNTKNSQDNQNQSINKDTRTVINVDKTMSVLKETKYSPMKNKNNNNNNNCTNNIFEATKTIDIKEIIINDNNEDDNNNKNKGNDDNNKNKNNKKNKEERRVFENKSSCCVVATDINIEKDNNKNNKNNSNNNKNNISSSLDLLSAYESAEEDLVNDDENNNNNDESNNNKNNDNNNNNNNGNSTDNNNKNNESIKNNETKKDNNKNNNNTNNSHKNNDGDSGDDLEISYQTSVKKRRGRRKNDDVKTSEPIKLFSYPSESSRGSISISNHDVTCLKEGEYFNDVIIDFYLKYLWTEELSEVDRQRTHIFSSFFYSHLTNGFKKSGTAVERHTRVRNWTRNVDVFEKDFIIIPLNQNYHWFLAVICFPGLCADPSFTPKVKNSSKNIKTDHEVIKHPVILILDSLNEGHVRWDISSTLREYLQEEWNIKRQSTEGKELFNKSRMKGCIPKCPQQNNFHDCGSYILLFVECFFKMPILDFIPPVKGLKKWFDELEGSAFRGRLRKMVKRMKGGDDGGVDWL